MSRVLRLFLLLSFVSALAAWAQQSDPANHSGLRGRTLTKHQTGNVLNDVAAAALSGDRSSLDPKDLLRGLLGSQIAKTTQPAAPKGNIVSARVVEDRDRSLVLEIAFSGIDASAAKVLVAEVRDTRGKPQPIVADPASITVAEGSVSLELRVGDSVGEGKTLESKTLALRIAAGANALQNDAIATFALPKRWAVPVRPENIVVEVTPLAVGAIPASDPNEGLAPPPLLFNPTILQQIRTPHLTTWGDANVRVPPPANDTTPAGPAPQPLDFISTIRQAPGLALDAEALTNVHPKLFRDANPKSGIFYYAPARYNLAWDKTNGYGLRVVYGTSADGAGKVVITARLASGLNTNEIELLRSLLRTSLGSDFKELRPLPHGGAPAVAMRSLGHYDIPSDKVAITGLAYLGGPAELSFTTDTITKENIETALTSGSGLSGDVTFAAAAREGAEGINVNVPLNVSIVSPHTFGIAYWRAGAGFRNETPFPAKLHYLHFLTIGNDGVPTVYSYSLGDAEVLPRSRANFADANVAPWLAARALRGWIEYSVVSDYEAGVQVARGQWTRGAGEASSGKLTITSLRPFAESQGLARIVVDIRSRYFDSRAQHVSMQSVTLTQDDQSIDVAPFFAPPDARDEPLFEYTLRIVKADGTTAGPTTSAVVTTADLFVGSSQLRALLGNESQ